MAKMNPTTKIAKTGVKVKAIARGANHVGFPFKPHCIGKCAAIGNLRFASTEDKTIAKITEVQNAKIMPLEPLVVACPYRVVRFQS